MNRYFCADASRQARENMIGSASQYQTYILIECPLPWAPSAFDSSRISTELKQFVAEANQLHPSTRFLLIHRGSRRTDSQKVLIYDRLNSGYQKFEWILTGCDEVLRVIQGYLAGDRQTISDGSTPQPSTRDILICTHGSHDQCCAKYGNPFYMEATSLVASLGLEQVRIWRSSHFGGHRFAPTAIAFPDGRYYGGLDGTSLLALLLQTGDVQRLSQVYRGWGILAPPLQVMERALMLAKGWDWFNYKLVGCKLLEPATPNAPIHAEVIVETPEGLLQGHRATLVQDPDQTVCLKGSCHAANTSTFVKYRVESLTNFLHVTASDTASPLLHRQLETQKAMRDANIVK
jgi:hypothetical protein